MKAVLEEAARRAKFYTDMAATITSRETLARHVETLAAQLREHDERIDECIAEASMGAFVEAALPLVVAHACLAPDLRDVPFGFRLGDNPLCPCGAKK